MKVLLMPAYLGRKGLELPSFPLGVAYLLGNLHKHECTVFDPNVVERPFVEIGKIVERTDPDVVALSLRNIDTTQSWDVFSYFQQFVSMLKFVKRTSPEAKIIVGGAGFSMFAEEIMEKRPEIDFGVLLEGEYSFPELLEKMDHPERVSGMYFRKNGSVFFTGRCRPVDFDQLPSPPREFPNLPLQKYKERTFSIGIQTKRGCVFNCAYCTYPLLQGRHTRLRSPKKVVDEVETLVNSHDVETVFFADTVFNFPLDHARDICTELLKRKISIKWRAWFREDFVNKRFMVEARNAGCDMFEFSPDGGSQDALVTLRKGIKIQDVLRTCELASEIEGIRVGYNFMYNIPGENLKTVIDFYRLLAKITTNYWKQIDFIGLSNIRIYPKTKVYQIALRDGVISENTDLLTPTFYNPRPSNALYSWAKWAAKPLNHLLRVLNPSRTE